MHTEVTRVECIFDPNPQQPGPERGHMSSLVLTVQLTPEDRVETGRLALVAARPFQSSALLDLIADSRNPQDRIDSSERSVVVSLRPQLEDAREHSLAVDPNEEATIVVELVAIAPTGEMIQLHVPFAVKANVL